MEIIEKTDEPICIREIKKNIKRVFQNKALTRPLATLNRICNFQERYELAWDLKNEKKIKAEQRRKEEKRREYGKEYNKRPYVRERHREDYSKNKEKYRGQMKKYRKTEKYKKWRKEYFQRPEVKKKWREYERKRYHRNKMINKFKSGGKNESNKS